MVIFALLASVFGSSLLAGTARLREGEATARLVEAMKAEMSAKVARAEAEAVVEFLEKRVFSAARPKGRKGELGHDVSLRDAVAAGLPALAEEFKDQPQVEARLRATFGRAFNYLGDYKAAEAEAERARAILTELRGPDHPDTLRSMHDLAGIYANLGRYADALKLLEVVLGARRRVLGPDHPHTLASLSNLAAGYDELGRHPDAVRVRLERVAILRGHLPAASPELASELATLAFSMLRAGQCREVEPILRECLAIREKAQPGAWSTYNTRSMLGGALLGQGKHAEAEPLLLAGYAGLKEREKTIPPQGLIRLPEAADRLVELYAATGKPDEAAKWRAERARYPFVAPPPRPREVKQ
jgi:eukaryotic-like serine/threonine-protein kinase